MKGYLIYENDTAFGMTEKRFFFLNYERARTAFMAMVGGWFLAFAADKELEMNRDEMKFYDAEGEDLVEMPTTAENFEVHGGEIICQIDKGLEIIIAELEVEGG